MVYDYNGQTTVKPASNMKLLTTAAALEVLGKDYRFNTSLYTTGKLSNGVLKGDVYLKGQGDPTLSIEDLQQFAEELKAQGIHKIDGRIVGDDKWFDDDLLTPGIWVGDESYYYAAPIYSFNYFSEHRLRFWNDNRRSYWLYSWRITVH